jgi:ABC-type Mn2+/Zn2+ transport system permease subunit
MMALAVILGAGCGWLGLVVSYEGSVRHSWRLASGATVVATLTAAFVIVAAGAALRRRAQGRLSARSSFAAGPERAAS